MKPHIKTGLVVGAIGLLLTTCVSFAIGFCGPVVALPAGIAAGYFASQRGQFETKTSGARAGLVSGGIAGALVLLGQLIGGGVVLALAQSAGVTPLFGEIPSQTADPGRQLIYYLGGLGFSLILGIIDMVLAASSGALVAYIATPERSGSIVSNLD